MAEKVQPELCLEFDASVYNAEACKRAAYVMMKDVVCDITTAGEKIICKLLVKSDEPAENVAANFRQEVLDQDLRLSIEAQTVPLRNLVLGLAFSRVGQNGEIH